MSRRVLSVLLGVAVMGLGLMHPAAARAGGPFGLLSRAHSGHAVQQQDGLHGVSTGPPGPHRYPEYNTGNYPWYGYGFGVPTYSWGYFGARYRPAAVSHKGYYGHYTQWGYRQGY